ncbi:alpha/beta fold hydrolase [Sneathiella limimaris]|uniref:alpha/beta fold hydrolase n=1 Tax=Sneathiella limimaris TaxID=1964213 RepID=UPI00146C97CE|nr:alpha/beta hydrolase [Sneathiella limimaris]
MVKASCNGIELEYEVIGNQGDPVIILIAGLGFQLIDWPRAFCEKLANEGFQVIRFDNRDVGLSEKLDHFGIPNPVEIFQAKLAGNKPDVPYHLTDMAADVVALVDNLAISKAHIVGMSMGGMIAQLLAIHYPDRALSLTSIMSSSSDPSLPGPTEEAGAVLASAPQSQEKSDIIDFGLKVNSVIGSTGYPWNKVALEAHIGACIDRCYSPGGYMRQYSAVMAAPSRREELKRITARTLVIHGSADTLVQPACGEDVANHIPNSQFELVEGMGHDLSPDLCDHLADLILPHISYT